MNKTYEKSLPEGYVEVFTVDAKKTSVSIILTIISFVIMLAVCVCGYFIIKPTDYKNNFSLLRTAVFLVSIVVYMILHELVHGIVYKLYTREKLTFGLTLSVAYCGVSDIYVYRKTALSALIAPFAVFTIVFLALMFILPNVWDKFYTCILFALHFGGCSGDLYGMFLFLFKFKSKDILMQDTGPKQTFYVKKDCV